MNVSVARWMFLCADECFCCGLGWGGNVSVNVSVGRWMFSWSCLWFCLDAFECFEMFLSMFLNVFVSFWMFLNACEWHQKNIRKCTTRDQFLVNFQSPNRFKIFQKSIPKRMRILHASWHWFLLDFVRLGDPRWGARESQRTTNETIFSIKKSDPGTQGGPDRPRMPPPPDRF